MESKCEKNNSPETASKARSKKLQEKTGDLVENKIAEKITKVSLKNKTNQQIKKKLTAEELQNHHYNEQGYQRKDTQSERQ